MLFIREYTAKSLDRSSVSMIDKYNTRLDRVGQLLDDLSSLINNLLSLIRDIRTLLGQSKQRIYDNLDQVKEVIEGNDITGTEATIKTIEDALAAGDKAIDEAEATLEGIEAAMECGLEYCNDANGNEECGEAPSEESNEEDCAYCLVSSSFTDEDGTVISSGLCDVCAHGECNVNQTCNEETTTQVAIDGCSHTNITDLSCGQTTNINQNCDEIYCTQNCTQASDGCNFSCLHSSDCQQLPIPDGCTYTCTDGGSCAYGGDGCSYGTVCDQADSCNQIDCGQYDCGEPCGETCHMTTDDDDSGDSGSCGEDDDLSDDDYYGGDDGDSDMCGEDCGDSCGL